jgi:parallel beta-helix repeat protein
MIHSSNTNIVQGNFIGTDLTGEEALGNGGMGVSLVQGSSANTIGGTNPGEGNLVSGNDGGGIGIYDPSNGNVVEGNFIGTDVNGLAAIGNAAYGVRAFLSSGNTIRQNVISGNGNYGVSLYGAESNVVVGNKIGTDKNALEPLPNFGGVAITNSSLTNTIGGLVAGDGNIIAGNTNIGILFSNGSEDNIVQGNWIGTNEALNTGLGHSGGDGIYITNSENNVIGGLVPNAGNIILFNRYGINAFEGDGTRILGNVISGSDFAGIDLSPSSGVLISGNRIGTDPAGLSALGNGAHGIRMSGASTGNTIGTQGTVSESTRNLISGNTEGVVIYGPAYNNVVKGNHVGTNWDGDGAIPNTVVGLHDSGGEQNHMSDNLVSGNEGVGIWVSDGAVISYISRNYIGTSLSGDTALPNTGGGVMITGAATNSTYVVDNLISGNLLDGIDINLGTEYNNFQGNLIGTDASGELPLGNEHAGIRVGGRALHAWIGGTDPGDGNIVCANGAAGIIFEEGAPVSGTFENWVEGNWIGTNQDLDPGLGNLGPGIVVAGFDHHIGGTAPGAGNVIAYNGVGISAIDDPGYYANLFLSNSIFGNTNLGIDLGEDGVTPNDPGDGDTGPNDLQNFPVLTAVISGGGTTTITFSLNSGAITTYDIEFFANSSFDPSGNGEGETFIGSTTVITDGSGNVALNPTFGVEVPTGQHITATATGPAGTSEFSNYVTVP